MPLLPLLVAVAVSVSALVPITTTPRAEATPSSSSLVRTPHNGQIFEVDDEGYRLIDWQEWMDRGYPSFVDVPSTFVKVLSMPTVYAVTKLSEDIEITSPITAAEYRTAKAPKIVAVPWVDGLEVYKWPTSDELFFRDVNSNVQKLTYAQWRAAGFPAFTVKENRGIVKLNWDASGAIAYMCEMDSGRGGKLSFAQWQALGAPTPKVVSRTATDFVYSTGTPDIGYVGPRNFTYVPGGYYAGIDPWRILTFREWKSMGYRTPVSRTEVILNDFWCEPGMPTPWE